MTDTPDLFDFLMHGKLSLVEREDNKRTLYAYRVQYKDGEPYTTPFFPSEYEALDYLAKKSLGEEEA